jgi:predicted ATPase
MHIKNVQLSRFKQFKKSKIDLKENLSLVVGGNNSGKSSILQALATWQFCKTILEIEKGRRAWVSNVGIQGVGMGIVDFTPMNVPSLAHLWTNLKTQKIDEDDGYTLKIKVTWEIPSGEEKFLEIGMSLANDRLFIKNTNTNLLLNEVQDEDGYPIDKNMLNVAYLPPFAGVTDRESRLTPAMRGRLIGQGLSGGVIRNALFDLHEVNKMERSKLRIGRTKIKDSDLKTLRETDPWEILQRTMQEIFGTELKIIPFNERYHSYLRVECTKGKFLTDEARFEKFPNFSPRDLMVEGSGFLQWLSVYALALSPELHVILLDEPDAHLHPSLQQQLVSQLSEIARSTHKQILLATHSTELIRSYEHEKILSLRDRKGKYLSGDQEKISVLAGIGAAHTLTLHSLIQHKRLLIVEGASDERFLRILAEKSGMPWPKNLVVWVWTGKHTERYHLYSQLKKDIPDLQAISIRDRDDEADATVGSDLVDKSFNCHPGFVALKWRRRHIENYLLCVGTIARCANVDSSIVLEKFAAHALAIPADITASDVPIAIRDARGKEILNEGINSLRETLGVSRDDIAAQLLPDEIAMDIFTFFNAICDLCKTRIDALPTQELSQPIEIGKIPTSENLFDHTLSVSHVTELDVTVSGLSPLDNQ